MEIETEKSMAVAFEKMMTETLGLVEKDRLERDSESNEVEYLDDAVQTRWLIFKSGGEAMIQIMFAEVQKQNGVFDNKCN